MALVVGDLAPDFALPGDDDNEHRLSELRGVPVVLLFYVGDDTPTCGRQLSEYNDSYAELRHQGARLLGISPGGQHQHLAFSCRLDLRFPLLTDVDRRVGKAYGVEWLLGVYRRSTFVIDADGVVRYAHRAGVGGYLRHQPAEEALAAVRLLTH